MKRIVVFIWATSALLFSLPSIQSKKLSFKPNENTTIKVSDKLIIDGTPYTVEQKHLDSMSTCIRLINKQVPIYEAAEFVSQINLWKTEYDYWITFEICEALTLPEISQGLARRYLKRYGNPKLKRPFFTPSLPSRKVIDAIHKQYFILTKDDTLLDGATLSFRELMCSTKMPIVNSRLKISGLHLSDLSGLDVFYAIPDMTQLDLSNNDLTSVPDSISNFSAITNLELSNNRIDTISPEIGKLKNLRKLDLSNNQLEKLPKEIGELSALYKLDITNNKISTLPKSLSDLKSLQWLDATQNQLTKKAVLKALPGLMHIEV